MTKLFPAKVESASLIADYAVESLSQKKLNEKLLYEYRLLFEEIALKMIEKAREDSDLTVEVFYRFGSWRVRLRCPGHAILLAAEDEDDFGGKILEQFSDRMQQAYSAGTNSVTFAATSTSNNILLFSSISVLAALLASKVLTSVCTPEQIEWIISNIVYPVVLLFTKCMQTVVVPVAFFSLSAFIINLYRTLDQNKRVARLALRYFVSSVCAMGIGALVVIAFNKLGWATNFSAFRVADENFMGQGVGEVLMNSVPSNIVEPLLSSNPLPMLVVATFVGLAAAKLLGSSGDKTRAAINDVSEFFCCMINIVYNTIPLFAFFAQVFLCLRFGASGLVIIGKLVAVLLLTMVLVSVFDLLRLWVGGISPIWFLRHYSDVLRENLKIASNIDAMPYNKRILLRRTSFKDDYLSEGLYMGALMNMDGNSAVVSAGILFLISGVGMELKFAGIVWIGLIILLLSLGAPNQPGSFLMSTTVLMLYVGVASELFVGALVMEALMCKFYSFLNSAGDIVSILLEDKEYQRAQEKKQE